VEDPNRILTIKEKAKASVKKHWFNGGLAATVGTWFAFDPTMVKELFTEAMQHDITRMTIAFIIAWKIVKRDMKRDMAEEFTGLRYEISKLGEGFKKVSDDILSHSTRLDKLDGIVAQLKTIIEKLIPRGS